MRRSLLLLALALQLTTFSAFSLPEEKEWSFSLDLPSGKSLSKDFFKYKNNVICLFPTNHNIYLTPAPGQTTVQSEDTEDPHFKTVLKRVIRAVWSTNNPELVSGYIFISNEANPALFNAGRIKSIKDMTEVFQNEFREGNLENGLTPSPEEMESSTARFINSVTFVHDPKSEAWKHLAAQPLAPESAAIFIVQPGGIITHAFTELSPDNIYARRSKDRTVSGAEKSALPIFNALR